VLLLYKTSPWCIDTNLMTSYGAVYFNIFATYFVPYIQEIEVPVMLPLGTQHWIHIRSTSFPQFGVVAIWIQHCVLRMGSVLITKAITRVICAAIHGCVFS
jgi:hypothetical protein